MRTFRSLSSLDFFFKNIPSPLFPNTSLSPLKMEVYALNASHGVVVVVVVVMVVTVVTISVRAVAVWLFTVSVVVFVAVVVVTLGVGSVLGEAVSKDRSRFGTLADCKDGDGIDPMTRGGDDGGLTQGQVGALAVATGPFHDGGVGMPASLEFADAVVALVVVTTFSSVPNDGVAIVVVVAVTCGGNETMCAVVAVAAASAGRHFWRPAAFVMVECAGNDLVTVVVGSEVAFPLDSTARTDRTGESRGAQASLVGSVVTDGGPGGGCTFGAPVAALHLGLPEDAAADDPRTLARVLMEGAGAVPAPPAWGGRIKASVESEPPAVVSPCRDTSERKEAGAAPASARKVAAPLASAVMPVDPVVIPLPGG